MPRESNVRIAGMAQRKMKIETGNEEPMFVMRKRNVTIANKACR